MRARAAAGITLVLALCGVIAAGWWARRRTGAADPGALGPAVLQAQVAGCAAVLRGPICEVAPDTELHLWLPDSLEGPLHVSTGSRELPTTVTPWPDGRTIRVTVPTDASHLQVTATVAGHTAVATVNLASPPAVPESLVSARALRKQGRLDEALAELSATPDADGAGPPSVILSARARIEYQAGRVEAATTDLRLSIERHETEGRLSEAAEDASTLTYLLLERSRISEARTYQAREAELSLDYPVGQADVVHNDGLLAWATGDLRTAVRRAREAEARFARLGADRRRRSAAVTLGLRLQELGRYADAITIYRSLLQAPDVAPCERADVLTDVGWVALQATEADAAADLGVDAREPLAQAREVLHAGCPDPNRLANVLENVALGELQHGRLQEARTALDEAKQSERDPSVEVALFWWYMSGRIALAQGAARDALASFEQQAEIAAAYGSVHDRRSAAAWQAEALIALGRRAQALDALDAADAFVDAIADSVPLGEGMDGFFATRERAAVLRVDLLAQLGRDESAMAAARRWRRRVLDGLRVSLALEQLGDADRRRWQDAVGRYRALRESMERETATDWQLSADKLAAARARREEEAGRARAAIDDAVSVLPRTSTSADMPPPEAGELELLLMPGPSGWLVFAHTADGTAMHRLERLDPRADPAELGQAILAPFDAQIARARLVRVMPYGAARAIDVHALPWHGRPLVEHAVVQYALGLPRPELHPDAGASTRSRALLVADPAGDLPAARAEADAVSHALATGRWTVEDLRGASAEGEAVRRELGLVDLLHYAGHASSGGVDGSGSTLSLAHGTGLTPADVLALARVPAIVSLFGCDTAHESATGKLDALGLTSAFLVGGARVVVATSRVVDDGLARDVAIEFSTRLAGGAEPGEALRQAVLTTRERAPASDWAAFRVLVP